jgi:hypothetical protein
MSAFLTSLQETSLALWVSESPSLLGYPTILAFHTIGLALLVGPSVAVDLRLLGVAAATPLGALRPLFGIMWTGLVINAVTGLLLFIADAVMKAAQPVFWVKLACIAGAVLILLRLRASILAAADRPQLTAVPRGRSLALASILLWTVAMIAGRLMAYM